MNQAEAGTRHETIRNAISALLEIFGLSFKVETDTEDRQGDLALGLVMVAETLDKEEGK